MTNIKLKVCGMCQPENIREIVQLQPDYMGLIFFKKSSRFVKAEIPEISSEVKKTGVFVNASIDFILKKLEKYQLQAIQLHGEESAEFCRGLRQKLKDKNIEIIKVFSVKEEFNFDVLEQYEGTADYFLFDTKGKNKGGNGITFNWEVLKNYPSTTPFFLSGGIGIEEAKEIKELVQWFQQNKKEQLLYAVDVNSRFEDAPGLKNIEKLQLFKDSLAKNNY
ncbi:phosphoribosylanthranilate isomerase [Autumnicola musiva]|uniref:N-(5'-phosphoribosyl)anthranilate isomerase n=1 Tax=Autumnicola musiva TaxID=3075589 RepID=A0ABU3D340_9FLAO|nr:phosphoribosylanthranilate isomerase [Zunongwangia sp. F117]MDT0675814.1 phosphoribosylanthranilate isomerase [Zunongwangia sp. F117]